VTDPLDYIHQTTVHQLEHAADEIEDGDGLVADFDYEEELEWSENSMMGTRSLDMRTVTLELTYILPE